MARIECPQPFDIEPTCFNFDGQEAWNHARDILSLTFPGKNPDEIESMIEPAIAFVIPSAHNSDEYLYGKRSPDADEFPDAWGLPSVSITKDQFSQLDKNGQVDQNTGLETVMKLRQKKGKITSSTITPKRIVGWTGRLRGPTNGYGHDYYLIMVDVQTDPIDPDSIATNTHKYTEFRWLTPDQHMDLTSQAENQACGACSALIYQYTKQGDQNGN